MAKYFFEFGINLHLYQLARVMSNPMNDEQKRATMDCPSLKQRIITPHTLRHTTAMHLLQSGVDLSVIALWLGHEQIDTTHQYMEINLEMKRVALNSLEPVQWSNKKRFKNPSDSVVAFLESL